MTIKKLFNLEWRLEKTHHFDYYVRPIDRKIKKTTLNKLDRHFEKICNLWKKYYGKQITYYLFSDRAELYKVLKKNTSGFAKTNERAIYSIYSFHPHEITHLVLNLGLDHYPLLAFSEGMAVLYGWKKGWNNKTIEQWKKIFKQKNKTIKLKKLLDKKTFKNTQETIYYPQYAAFVKFYIKNFGIKKFKILYNKSSNSDNIKITIEKIEKNCGLKLTVLEQKYLAQ